LWAGLDHDTQCTRESIHALDETLSFLHQCRNGFSGIVAVGTVTVTGTRHGHNVVATGRFAGVVSVGGPWWLEQVILLLLLQWNGRRTGIIGNRTSRETRQRIVFVSPVVL